MSVREREKEILVLDECRMSRGVPRERTEQKGHFHKGNFMAKDVRVSRIVSKNMQPTYSHLYKGSYWLP